MYVNMIICLHFVAYWLACSLSNTEVGGSNPGSSGSIVLKVKFHNIQTINCV